MKYILSILSLVLCLAACSKKEETPARVETRSATNITDTEAVCWGKIVEQGSGGIKEYGIEWQEFGEVRRAPCTTAKADSFGVQLTGLNKGTKYKYAAYVIDNNGNVTAGSYRNFSTFTPAEFSIIAKNVTDQSINIEFTNIDKLKEWGFYYSTNAEVATSDTKVEAKGEKVVAFTGLTPYTQYYLLPYAIDKNGINSFADVYNVMSGYALPVLTTPGVSAITASGAAVTFEVTSTGGGNALQECGVRYSTDGQNWTKKTTAYAEGTITYALTGLNPGTKYKLQAYGKNHGDKEGFSETIEFTTAGTVPALAKPTITALKTYKVNMAGGKVSNDGQLTVTEYGFCWSTTSGQAAATGSNYTKVTAGSKDAFEYLNYSLLAGTKYYVRAYAKNQVGTGYSEEVSVSIPAVQYGQVTDRWDNNTKYKTVQIGNQTWMAENLRNNRDGSRSFILNDVEAHLTDACPTDWHIPTKSEFDDLITEAGGKIISASTLRAKEENIEQASNSTGFGLAITNHRNAAAGCWTSTLWQSPIISITLGRYIAFFYSEATTELYHYDNAASYPIRCLKDN